MKEWVVGVESSGQVSKDEVSHCATSPNRVKGSNVSCANLVKGLCVFNVIEVCWH